MDVSTLFINGKIWQEDGSFKESLGLRGDIFDFLGNNVEGDKIQQNYEKVINLKGKTVLPGLIDSHVHFVFGSLLTKRIDCGNIKDLDELVQIIEKKLNENKNSHEWIIGANLDISRLAIKFENGNPLDKLPIRTPLFFINYDYHSALANGISLERSGLINKLSEYSNEEIPKDNKGNPTGHIKESAMDFVFKSMPKPSLETKIEAVCEFIKTLHSYGITAISDITLPEDLEAYSELNRLNRMSIRISTYLPILVYENIGKYLDSVKSINADFFRIKGFKTYYDGSLGSQTGLFKENYTGKNSNGLRSKIAASGKLPGLFKALDDENWQLITHAIGDKAVEETLCIYEDLLKVNGPKDRRPRIEHAQHIDENDFGRFIEPAVIVSAQPMHLKFDAGIVEKSLPYKIKKRTHNYKRLIEMGVKVCFGTDFPIVGINPFENIQMAVMRKIGDKYFTPENAIDLHNCIKCYTINGAHAAFNESRIGSVSKGKKADFIILNNDIFSVPEYEIEKIKVEETYVNGEKVYSIYD